MKPTLYADDIREKWTAEGRPDVLLLRMLPRRCHQVDCENGTYVNYAPPGAGETMPCSECRGAGFLYPDSPDIWNKSTTGVTNASAEAHEEGWRWFCDTLYRVLEIIE